MSHLSVPVNHDDHVRGPDNAAITLVEYGDFQCPYCAMAHQNLLRVEESLGGDLRVVFRHFPLIQIHGYAFLGSEAAEAAGRQGKFWEMHDLIFGHQERLSPKGIIEFAATLDLNMEKFEMDMNDESIVDRIQADFDGGLRSGVKGTPSFFLNGVKYEGPIDPAIFGPRKQAA